MWQIDPELLRTFVTIAETGSFQRAAKRVHRTQSAVSMQINRLEEMIGHPVFVRERPAVSLTPKGVELLSYAHRILALQDEAWGVLSDTKPTGEVRFGIPDDYAAGILPQILEQFAENQPQIVVEVQCETTPRLIEMVDMGEVDLALISRIPGRPAGQFVKRERLVWATSPRHATHLKNPVPLAVFQEECFARQYAINALLQAGRQTRIAFSSPHLAALLSVAHSGLAIAAMPRSSVPKTLRILGVRDGFPELPDIDLDLIHSPNQRTEAMIALAACIWLEDGAEVGI